MKRFVYIFLALVCCAVSVSATNVSIPGSMNNWDISASTMTLSEDSTASISYTLNAGNYEYKIAFESWSDCLSTSTTITRENNSATFSASYSGNAIFQADVTGDYMFTWTFATNTLTVTYPEAGVQQCGNDLYWSLANGTLTITGSGAMYDYSSGSAPWYNERSSIKNLSLPEGLTHIGQYAFYYCSALQSITIPNSVTSIGNSAFYDCNGFASITIPDNVTTIGKQAFYSCENLISVALGSGITSIGSSAFYYCNNLDYIRIDAQTPPTLGNSGSIYSSPICYVPVGTLEAYQASSWASYVSRFEECEQQITCAEAATRCLPTPSVVHYTIYGYVTELTENYSSASNTISFWMADMPIGGKVLYAHNVVPNATTDRTPQKGDYVKLQGYIMLHDAIPSTAEGCTMEILSAPTSNLTTQCGDSLYWMLSDSTLTIVGSGMMYDYSTSAPAPWSELKNSFHTLVLPQGLTTIGDNAFADCAALQAVAIPTTVTNIGAAAFQNCTALTQVLIPEGVQHLEDNAFKGCSALATVYAQAQIPPVLGNMVFNSKPVCYVPTGGVLATYQVSTWANFATSFEEQDKKCGDNLYYLFADSTLTIVGTGEMNYSSRPWTSTAIARVFLPDGLKSIGSSAFYNSQLTSIALPNTITTINYQAFRGCSQLTSIVLPDSITSIGQDAFYYSGIYNSTANWEDGALYIGDYLIATNSNLPATYAIKEGTRLIADYTFSGKSSSLTSVIIPESVVGIGEHAFYNCDALTYIRIPSSVKNIGRESFYDCSQLAFVDLSEGVETIDSYAFYSCPSLTHITIPSTLISIGEQAFYTGDALTVYVEATTPPMLGNYAFNASNTTCYLLCGLLGEYVASSAWSNLFGGFVEYCPSDNDYNFESSEMNAQWQFIQEGQGNYWTIGTDAGSASWRNHALYVTHDGSTFEYNHDAASTSWAYIPVSLTTSDTIFLSWKGEGETCCDYAYAYLIPASSLPTAGSTTLPEGAIAITNKLNQQTAWQLDTITPNVEGNYNLCFMWTNDESSGTSSVVIDDVYIGSTASSSVNKCGDDLYWTLADSTLTITGSGAMYEYANKQMIPWYNQRNNIAYVSLPDGLTNIARNAFYNCDALRTVNIPNGVTSIGRDAFYDCDALTTITLPNTVTNIGNRVFYDCYNLSSAINIPEGVTAIGDSTFYNCNRITSITIPNTVTSIGTYAFYNCDGISDIIIPNSVTTINDHTFYNCDGFTSIIIPNSVTSIGIYAFGYCYNLASVTIGNAVSSLADYAFYNCSVLDIVYVLSQTPPALGTNALYSTPLCYIPAGTLAAYQASDWANYVSGFAEQGQCGDNLYWTISDGMLSITGSGAMYDYTAEALAPWYGQLANITTINLPDGLTSIGAWAFYDCDAISSISIPNTVTAIGNEAFYHCSSLTSLSIPDAVTTLGYEALANCTLLTNVSLGSSIMTIGDYAFSYCPALAKMTLKSETPPTIGDYIFSNSSAPTCYIPCGTLSAYQSSAWATLVASIEEQCYDENYHNFEVDIQNDVWQFVQDGQINYWTIGTAAGSASTGSNALYITNNGSDYSYTISSSSTSWAYIPVTLETTDTISFSWKGVGESGCDYLSVYLFPADYLPTAGSTSTPSGAVAVASSLCGQTEWQFCTATPAVSGNYNLCFMWRNDGSVGETPIAVDDIRIGNTAPVVEVGNITYELNGGVTNDYGWMTKNDMFQACMADAGVTGLASLDELKAAGDASFATICAGLDGTRCQYILDNEKWDWLETYIMSVQNADASATTLTEGTTSAGWRYALAAFFLETKRTSWPVSADFSQAGTVQAFMPAWQHGFANPTAPTTSFVLNAPYKEGYTFGGWYTNATFSGSNITTVNASTTGTLYAKWIEGLGTSGLTYNVTVPAGTSACYIAGDMNGWTFTEMTKVNNTHFTITIEGATTDMTYKYCSGPAWDYVEKDAYGNEISARTYSTNDVVESWANIYQPLPTTVAVDAYTYPTRQDKYLLKNNWIYSDVVGNFSQNKPANTMCARGMAVKDGIMYFIDRETESLIRVDGATGAKLEPIKIVGENLFKVMYYETGEMVQGCTYGYNDIQFDDAGNCLISSLATNSETFFVYLIDLETGQATELINEQISATYPEFTRIDCIGVAGDVTSNGVVMAAESGESWNVYRWKYNEWGYMSCEMITPTINNSLFVNANGWGTSPRIYPITSDGALFYVDGFNTLPMMFYDEEAGDDVALLIDDFINVSNTVVENATGNTIDVCQLNESGSGYWGHNGVCEFKVGDEYFLVMAATNTHYTPASTFALYRFTGEYVSFAELEPLWFFPNDGMGSITNGTRTAIPEVEVVNNTAYIYVYTGENGYACYELNVDGGNDTIITPTPASDYHNFEDASLNAQWQFIQEGQTNFWTIGTAAGSTSGGSNALYITNDGYNYSYNNSAVSVSWAYIPVELISTDTISFNWKGMGESSYDNMRVYLYPTGTLPTAGSANVSNDAVQVTSTYLCGQSDWQTFAAVPGMDGTFNLCFMWKNDGSAGSTPIAVDEVRIAHFSAPANPENQCGDNLYWAYSNGTLTITGSGAMYDGNDLLTYHQQSWFPDEVTRVNLPNGMTHIGATAFADCSNLTSISIPSSVVSIGEAAFAWSGLQTLTLPEGVQNIYNMAFANCGHLTKFIYRGTPNELGNATTPMFLGCNQLDTIIAPARMWDCPEPDATVQEYYGFPSHIRYIEVTGGELSATNISYMANSRRTLLTLDISSASNNALPNQAFINWTALETLRLPDFLTEIPYQMAYACENLKAIAIPSFVAVIGDDAFRGCGKLSSIDFADSQNLYSIGQYAFAECLDLLSVEVPEGVQTLGAYAFRNTGLVQLRLPSTLYVIGDYTFYSCSHLSKMNVAAYTPPTVSSYTFYNVPRTAKVYVPEGAVTTYKSTAVWREFFIESNVQDAVDNILTEGEEQTQKLLINGQVIIIRNGKSYNLMGQEL